MRKIILFIFLLVGVVSWQTFAQFTESFEGATFPPPGWTVINDGDPNTWVQSTNAHTGLKAVEILRDLHTAHDDWLVTPAINVTAGVSDRISFWAKNRSHSYEDRFYVLLSTTGTAKTDFTITLDSEVGPGNIYERYEYDLSAYAGQTVYVAIWAISSNQWLLYVDDFENNAFSSCSDPKNLRTSNITDNQAVLSWTPGGTETNWNIEYGTSGFTHGQGIVVSTSSNPYTLTGLTVSTMYDFYVQADCGNNETSYWEGPYTFTTNCGAYTPYYSQDFTHFLPPCWDVNQGPITGPTGTPGHSVWVSDGFANVGSSGSAQVKLYSTYFDEWLISLEFDLSAGGYELNFDVAVTSSFGTNASEMGSDDIVALLVTTDGGATWNTLQTWQRGNSPSNTGDHVVVDLSSYNQNSVQFAFWASDGSVNDLEDYHFYMDNFIITCLRPTALSASNITDTQADLFWTSNGNETAWNIEYGPAGFSQGQGTVVNVTTNPYTLTGLNANTGYDFYVQANCSGGGASAWVGPYTFTSAVTISDNQISGFNYYPNPVNYILNLSANDNINHVVVNNIVGQEVIKTMPKSRHAQINMSHLSSGIYFVKVEVGGELTAFKIVKK